MYFEKLIGRFKLINKSNKKNGFDPVTNIDRALELFLRKEITKKFPKDGIIGEEFKEKKTKSGFYGGKFYSEFYEQIFHQILKTKCF